MRIYLASPGNQLQADAARGMPVLLSYGAWLRNKPLMKWASSYERILLDSGAFSELNSGVKIDIDKYVEWVHRFSWKDNWAGLDDISGDWRRSLKNYELGGFPTFHDTDPPELLDDLIAMSRERGNWIGIGIKPPRQGKRDWMRRTLHRIPDELHVHGWACGIYSHLARFDAIDSTHWWREAMKYRRDFPWLTYGECLEIAVKKVKRFNRIVAPMDDQLLLPADFLQTRRI